MTMSSTTITEERYFKPTDIEAIYKIPVSTLAQWRSRGIGPRPTRLPGSRLIRYSESSIRQWLDSGDE